MLKKSKKLKKPAKKLGRTIVVKAEDLHERYKDLRQFLEHNWGRIGLKLQQARRPNDIKIILKLVPGVASYRAFRDQPAGCLLDDGSVEVEKRELDQLRQQHKDATADHDRLWSEYHSAVQKADAATNAVKAAISQYEHAFSVSPSFPVVDHLAEELEVEKLTSESNRIKTTLDLARQRKQLLEEQLVPGNAWFARNEIVKFRNNKLHERSAVNFAKAMAGLPHYGWLYSFRKCSKNQDQLDTATSYLLFEVLKAVVKKVKPIDLEKIEAKLRDEILRPDADLFIKDFGAQNWPWMELAISDCRGQRFQRDEWPYQIMGRFLDHLERPKFLPELELAKRKRLVYD